MYLFLNGSIFIVCGYCNLLIPTSWWWPSMARWANWTSVCVCKWRDWDFVARWMCRELRHYYRITYLVSPCPIDWLSAFSMEFNEHLFCCDCGFPMKRNSSSTVQRTVAIKNVCIYFFSFYFAFNLHAHKTFNIYIYAHDFRWSKNVSHIHQPTAINAFCIHWRWRAQFAAFAFIARTHSHAFNHLFNKSAAENMKLNHKMKCFQHTKDAHTHTLAPDKRRWIANARSRLHASVWESKRAHNTR